MEVSAESCLCVQAGTLSYMERCRSTKHEIPTPAVKKMKLSQLALLCLHDHVLACLLGGVCVCACVHACSGLSVRARRSTGLRGCVLDCRRACLPPRARASCVRACAYFVALMNHDGHRMHSRPSQQQHHPPNCHNLHGCNVVLIVSEGGRLTPKPRGAPVRARSRGDHQARPRNNTSQLLMAVARHHTTTSPAPSRALCWPLSMQHLLVIGRQVAVTTCSSTQSMASDAQIRNK